MFLNTATINDMRHQNLGQTQGQMGNGQDGALRKIPSFVITQKKLNMLNIRLITAALTSAGCLAFPFILSAEPAPRPNIIHIFADDMGWGSVGAYGSEIIETPNLDTLAEAGMRFDRSYAATVCAPSRAMLMTGFHNGHTFMDRNANIAHGFRSEDITVAEILKDAGYTTAVLGKWGFGGGFGEDGPLRANPSVARAASLPQNQGYEYLYGYINHRRAHSYQVDSLWTTIEPPAELKYSGRPDHGLWLEKTGNTPDNVHAAYTMDLIAARAEQLIVEYAQSEQPFYLQLNHLIPHFDVDSIAEAGPLYDLDGEMIAPAGLGIYADHPDLSDKAKKHAAMITRMDASLGALFRRLEDPFGDGEGGNLFENTLVMFTSDNGPSPEDGVGLQGLLQLDATGGLRGGKRDLWEGGIRVPMIARWDGHIPAGATSDLPTDLADFLPTAAELAGVRGPPGMDGVSIVPTLINQGYQLQRDYLIFESHESRGPGPDPLNRRPKWTIIRGDEKLIAFRDGSLELYDLAVDHGETDPLDPNEHAELIEELQRLALAEGVEQPDGYAVAYAQWQGGEGDRFEAPENWSLQRTPGALWSASLVNADERDSLVQTRGILNLLGLEVGGEHARQTLLLEPASVLEGRNEIRVGENGRLHLESAQLRSRRWIEIEAGGELTGYGLIEGDVFNAGTLSPGRPIDLPEPPDPPTGVDTGSVTAIDFDFRGQDEAPMTHTETLSEYVELLAGFDFGLGVSPRNAGDVGDEFNVMGHNSASLTESIAAQDYLNFTIAPVPGVAMTIETIEVNLWRNGSNAANDFAILTSEEGFHEDAALGHLRVTDAGIDNQHRFVVTLPDAQPVTGPVEVRIYGWNAGQENGNTHFNDAAVTASFASVPVEETELSGVLTVEGSYRQMKNGTLQLEISGSSPGEFGRLEVGGDFHAAGGVTLQSGEGYQPQAGDSFALLSWEGASSGWFDRIETFDLEPGLGWDLSLFESQGVISVVREKDRFESAMTEAGLSGESSAATASPFGDGASNLIKYAFNLDLDRGDFRRLSIGGEERSGLQAIGISELDTEPTLRIEYLRRKHSGLIYLPEVSPTLEEPSFTPPTAAPVSSAIDSEWERVIISEPIPSEQRKAFARIQVVLPR